MLCFDCNLCFADSMQFCIKAEANSMDICHLLVKEYSIFVKVFVNLKTTHL